MFCMSPFCTPYSPHCHYFAGVALSNEVVSDGSNTWENYLRGHQFMACLCQVHQHLGHIWTDTQTDRQADRQTDRQTDREKRAKH